MERGYAHFTLIACALTNELDVVRGTRIDLAQIGESIHKRIGARLCNQIPGGRPAVATGLPARTPVTSTEPSGWSTPAKSSSPTSSRRRIALTTSPVWPASTSPTAFEAMLMTSPLASIAIIHGDGSNGPAGEVSERPSLVQTNQDAVSTLSASRAALGN